MKTKATLQELAQHLELLADGLDIITRLSPLAISALDDIGDLKTSRDKTLQAAMIFKELAQYPDKLRAFMIEQRGNK